MMAAYHEDRLLVGHSVDSKASALPLSWRQTLMELINYIVVDPYSWTIEWFASILLRNGTEYIGQKAEHVSSAHHFHHQIIIRLQSHHPSHLEALLARWPNIWPKSMVIMNHFTTRRFYWPPYAPDNDTSVPGHVITTHSLQYRSSIGWLSDYPFP